MINPCLLKIISQGWLFYDYQQIKMSSLLKINCHNVKRMIRTRDLKNITKSKLGEAKWQYQKDLESLIQITFTEAKASTGRIRLHQSKLFDERFTQSCSHINRLVRKRSLDQVMSTNLESCMSSLRGFHQEESCFPLSRRQDVRFTHSCGHINQVWQEKEPGLGYVN